MSGFNSLSILGLSLVALACIFVFIALQRKPKALITKTINAHSDLVIVILAAGLGKRMHSDLPKVLHPIGGIPILTHVLENAAKLSPKAIYVIYGHGGEQVRSHYQDLSATWVLQNEQLGTAHAVSQVLPYLDDNNRLLVLCGDVPLLHTDTLTTLLASSPADALGLLVAEVDNPAGLGRITRDATGHMTAIVEEKDADPATRAIKEVYSGVMVAPVAYLRRWLPLVDNKNQQGEYYLTSIIALALKDGVTVTTSSPMKAYEISGVNDRAQLAELERIYQYEQATALALAGVTIADLHRINIRGSVVPARDCFIDVNVILQGKVILGEGCRIGSGCVLTDVHIEPFADIRPYSVIDGASVGTETIVGPFARIRPGTVLHDRAVIGNFVEVKQSTIGVGSKASHLSYIGDATVGKGVNIGAGTITCNYDGVNKHQTVIGDYAFVGSNTSLVAPIHVGQGATLGAGSTVSKDVPAEQLTVARAKAVTLAGWQRPQKQDNQETK